MKLIGNETTEKGDERWNGYITGTLSMYEMRHRICDIKQQ